MLADKSFQSPNTHISQALLVMALYEWGSREFHRAWIYIGIAIRIMQALNSHRIAPYPLEPSPPAERDAVGGIGQEFTRRCEGTAPLDITRSFEVLVTGFDIWTDVMAFVLNDGRRAPGMCTANKCPWVPESTWGKTRQRLETWRANQHHRLRYPENTVVAHKTLGFGESFTYLNLLYYLSTLMLHREYFPFLPTAVSVPRGPVDQPTLEAEAPEGWWDTSALELFGAAEQIANLLHDASQCGANMLTPFIGFCAFSAAYMNLYIYRFPHMNLNRSLQASTSLEYCRAYLEDFRHVWKLGESWMTTINHASILYQRAASDKSRYQGKSREDFNVLHQSIHEFRLVDRSDQHIREIEGADIDFASPSNTTPAANVEPDLDLDGPLSNLLNEASTNAYEQGMWSHWWPSLDEINLPSFRDAEA
ncbi:ATPase WRNIP1 homolog C26H5.02c [Aspergillus udagawae]|uniref:ATPase WRNIP1 homolog C26H5.02c n=1 Tax=Aspergillus udagawae TaxID=91492 RepID=A0ABQ1B7L2_9EURO|nr:ATPase WRNIP1 homolog C26H5.02c [Aspergillus udagawae]GFF95410.1 ATPase WRNIP1 homolog C26H5.02c [Aspergillus udagawae]